jgi:DNA repair protein RecN (Recombination protein N)
MLRELRIQNFTIIESLELNFSDGLTVLTGETGAGKSILVDALELLLGGRSSTDQIRTGSHEAILEAAFSSFPKHPATAQLKEMELLKSGDEEILIRRIISQSGKGRAYLNGGLIPLGLLQQLGESLVDFHGQHEHQSLLKGDHQMDLLDAYGGHVPLRDTYQQHYERLLALKREREELRLLEHDRSRLEDLLRFQEQEIKSARLRPGEEEELDQERQLLSHAERLSAWTAEAYDTLYEADGSILSRMSRIEFLVNELTQIDPRLEEVISLTSEANANLNEIAERLRAYRDQVEYDPRRLEEIEDRLHWIGRLKKKYGGTVEEVLDTLEKVEEELRGLSGREERLSQIDIQEKEQQSKVEDLARKLTRERRRSAKSLEKEMQRELKHLGMARTTFEVRMKPQNDKEDLGSKGAEEAAFMIAPNPGEEARMLSRIASGGELSRMMLALKVILGDVDRVPTLVFDEVDAGIGGAVAEVVGERLRAIAKRRQVLCITHLPQIAAYATTHIAVEKRLDGGRTTARASSLSERERVDEIARMLGGREITPTAVKHAREMLDK